MAFVVQFFYILALVVWVGGIVFFSFFTTPIVFTHLPREMGSQLISALFPRYYLLGYGAGALLFLSTLLEVALVRQWPWLRLGLIALMLGCTFYAGMVVRPQVHQIKVELKAVEEATPLGQKLKTKFDQAHRLSVLLNIIVLISGLCLIGILAFRLKL